MVNFFQVGSRFSDAKSRSIDPELNLHSAIWLLIAKKVVGILFFSIDFNVFLYGFLHIFMANSEIMSREL